MYIAGTAQSVPLLKVLVNAGVSVNLAGHAGITTLNWAAQLDRHGAMRYLVEVGAELDAVTLEDRAPLRLAVSVTRACRCCLKWVRHVQKYSATTAPSPYFSKRRDTRIQACSRSLAMQICPA